MLAGPPPPARSMTWGEEIHVCVSLGALDAALLSVGYKRTTNTGVPLRQLVFTATECPSAPPLSVTVELRGAKVPELCRFCDAAVGECDHCADISHVRMGHEDVGDDDDGKSGGGGGGGGGAAAAAAPEEEEKEEEEEGGEGGDVNEADEEEEEQEDGEEEGQDENEEEDDNDEGNDEDDGVEDDEEEAAEDEQLPIEQSRRSLHAKGVP